LIHSGISEDSTEYINNSLNGHYFVLNIPWKKRRTFTVPFAYRTITATSLPFRVDLTEGMTQSDFLNFNMAYLWVYGRTKYFKNDDINPRNVYLGVGPYVGLINIIVPSSANNAFGLTYGATAVLSIYNINLVSSFGISNGFTKITGTGTPYIGFGIGFNLVSLSDPSN
jgi:hypothetical protein